MYYYHVISDIPKHQGERFVLDESHPNGVYQRVYAQLDVIKEIYRNPQKFEGTKLSHAVDVALRELALEKIRKEKYSQYPSRMASLYVSNTYEEAVRCCFIGDAYKCFDGTIWEKENLRMADLYWENGDNEDGHAPIVEILVDGMMEIVELIKETGNLFP